MKHQRKSDVLHQPNTKIVANRHLVHLPRLRRCLQDVRLSALKQPEDRLDGAPVSDAPKRLQDDAAAPALLVRQQRQQLGYCFQAADAAESGDVAASLDSNDGVYFVPALAGLGSPHWAPDVRGLVAGLTRGTRREHLVRAALEASAYQVQPPVFVAWTTPLAPASASRMIASAASTVYVGVIH